MLFSAHTKQACFLPNAIQPQTTILRYGSATEKSVKAIVTRATENKWCAVYGQDECVAPHPWSDRKILDRVLRTFSQKNKIFCNRG